MLNIDILLVVQIQKKPYKYQEILKLSPHHCNFHWKQHETKDLSDVYTFIATPHRAERLKKKKTSNEV